MFHTCMFMSEKNDIFKKKLQNGDHLGFFQRLIKSEPLPIFKNLTFLSLSHPTDYFSTKYALFIYKIFFFENLHNLHQFALKRGGVGKLRP